MEHVAERGMMEECVICEGILAMRLTARPFHEGSVLISARTIRVAPKSW